MRYDYCRLKMHSPRKLLALPMVVRLLCAAFAPAAGAQSAAILIPLYRLLRLPDDGFGSPRFRAGATFRHLHFCPRLAARASYGYSLPLTAPTRLRLDVVARCRDSVGAVMIALS